MRSLLSKALAAVLAVLLGASALAEGSGGRPGELQKFAGVKYVPSDSNDGDSFLVMLEGKEHCVRLYFVDCPETSAANPRRVREQKRYFGLEEPSWVIELGIKAKEYVQGVLSRPFTVHTGFAAAGGRTAGGRIYAFVTTPEGKDLARLLVARGYARAFGLGRKTPAGASRDETKNRLGDLEVAAGMKKVGIWEKSDPDRIVEMREEQRVEDKELAALQEEVEEAEAKEKFDLNTANKRKLQRVNGIGPAKAQMIIDGRPYERLDDVTRVKGIGSGMLEKLRACAYVLEK